jgi:hypothetical protein
MQNLIGGREMARPCILCEHAQRREIEAAIIAGRSLRSLSAEYGITYGAIHRHRHNHLPATVRVAAQEALERACNTATASGTQMPSALAQGLPGGVPDNALAAIPEASFPTSPVRRRTRVLQLSDTPPAPPADVGSPPITAPQPTQTAAPAAGVFNLYQSATDLRERAMAILAAAERDRDAKTALMAIREARGVLDHMSRLEERQVGNAAAVSLAESPEWQRTRAAIITALADHPEARLAVAEALISTGALH